MEAGNTMLMFRPVDSSWNVMAHGDVREGKWRGKWRMEWVASTLHATSEHGVSSITTADAHTSAASSRLNWRPPADLNGRVRFAERRNLVSASVPSHFKRSLPQFDSRSYYAFSSLWEVRSGKLEAVCFGQGHDCRWVEGLTSWDSNGAAKLMKLIAVGQNGAVADHTAVQRWKLSSCFIKHTERTFGCSCSWTLRLDGAEFISTLRVGLRNGRDILDKITSLSASNVKPPPVPRLPSSRPGRVAWKFCLLWVKVHDL